MSSSSSKPGRGVGDKRRALRSLEGRLRRVKDKGACEVMGRLERNLAGQTLLAEMQAALRGEQAVLVAQLRAAWGRGRGRRRSGDG